LGKLYKEQTRRKLSQSSIETLAIIAYKQPITKPEIESIRGVNCDYVLSTLLEKDLATIVGRAPTVGRPLLYGTSREFLKHFGLNDLNDLPRPREIQEILGDSQFETERRMLEAQQGVEEKKEEEFKSRLPHIPKRKPGLDNEVKILPKKRVRDINIRKSENESAQKPSELPAESAETPFVPEVQELPAAVQEPAAFSDVPIAENLETEDSAVERPIEAPEVPERIDSALVTTIGLNPPVEPEPFKETSGEEVVDGVDLIAGSREEESSAPPETELTERPVLGQSTVAEVQPAEPADQVEGEAVKAIPKAELQPIEEPNVQEEPPALVAEGKQDQVEEVPMVVSPIIEEHLEPTAAHKPQSPVDVLQAGSEVPHPKTRWKSWKEKIQGFIKKLFG
jgi:hypothetical protein